MKPAAIASIALLFLFYGFNDLTFADSTSANYALVEDHLTGGGGKTTSTNYELEETSFGQFGQAALASTNYVAETKVGISGGLGIAVINSISPADFAKLYSDENASYTVQAISQDGDTLQYRAKQDSTTKAGPQASNVLSWSLSTSDQGRHTMTLEAIDPHGSTIKKQDAYVVRRPTK